MQELKTLYKLSHYYSFDDKEQSFYIKSEIPVDRLVKILGSIEFKMEELISDEISFEQQHIVELLEKYYGVENVSDEYKELHPLFKKPKDEWGMSNVIRFVKDKEYKSITQIDLYEARESCCGKQSDEIMKKHLPENKEFEKDILNLKEYYQTQL